MVHIKKIAILLIFVFVTSLFACNAQSILPDFEEGDVLSGDNHFENNDNANSDNANSDNSNSDNNTNINPDNNNFDNNTNTNIDNKDNNAQKDTPEELPPVIKIPTEVYIMAKGSLNIRSLASTSGKIVGKMDKNDMLLYLGQQGNWYKTIYKDKTAYVSASTLYSKLVEIEKSNNLVEKILNIGYPLLGYPYIWGSSRYHWGDGTLNTAYVHGRYDCSALVQYMYFLGAGIKLGLTTREQVRQGTLVAKADIVRGDLLFFTNSSRKYLSGIERVGHVAVYLGNNYILHTASDFAVIEPITSQRWGYYIQARRFV